MRSPTTILTSVLIPAMALATVLTGCGRDGEPALPPENATRTAPLPADPLDSATPAGRPGITGPGSIFDAPASASDLERAGEVLVEVGRVYREAPTLADELALNTDDEPQVMRLRFDRNNERVEMSLPSQVATYIDGQLFLTTDFVDDLYLEVEGGDDPAMAIAQNFNWVPPYHFAMRAAGDLDDAAAVDSYLSGLGLGILRNPRLRGYALYTDDDGREFHRLTIDSSSGVGQVFIAAETMLVMRMEMQVLPPPGQPAHLPPRHMRIEANPAIADELAQPIVFEPSDRERVTEPEAMMLRTLVPGDRIPNLRFETADGEVVRLADLRGYVVIVDFWATWCIPCLQGLPHLDRFSKWVDEENQPVKVLAVNTMEQHETFEERREAIEKFWSDRGYSAPLVYDVESRAVERTGYMNIPLLFVIDPEGRITRVKDRFNRNMYQILKAEVGRALRAVEVAGDDDE